LVRRSEWGDGCYGRKSEQLFGKYCYEGENSGWVLYARDGGRFHFGTTMASRQSTGRGVFSWHLDRIEDANGNHLTVSYLKDGATLYPAEVAYSGHEASGLAPTNRVVFIIEDRPDKISDGRSGEIAFTAKRLSAIELYAGDRLCRIYRLAYGQADSSGRSQLAEIVVYGADGIAAMPPVTLEYHEAGEVGFEEPRVSNRPIRYRDTSGEQEQVSIADVNGDGRADIIVTRGTRLYHRISKEGGAFDEIELNHHYQIGELIGHADVNGDGFSDIIGYWRSSPGSPVNLYVHLGKGNGTYKAPVISKVPGALHEAPSYLQSTPGAWDTTYDPAPDCKLRCDVHLADVNGDGLNDIVFTYGTRFDHKLSKGDGTFRAMDRRFPYNYAGQPLGFLDVNGDALADFLSCYRNGKDTIIYAFMGKGNGTYREADQSRIVSKDIPGDAVPTMGDVTGDGHPDVILKRFQQCWLIRSNGNGTFERGDNFSIPLTKANQTYFADVTGDGVDDFLGFWDLFSAQRQYIYTSPNRISAFQGLLKSLSGGAGARFEVSYRSSDAYCNGLLPFAVNTVAQVAVNDGLGGVSVTEFDYAGGLFDPITRSFAGFEAVSKTNPDRSIVAYRLHQDEHRRGLAYRIELREPEAHGRLLSLASFDWATFQLKPDASVFVYLDQKTLEYLHGDPVFVRDRFDYDTDTGNLITHETSGTGAETVTKIYSYQNFGDWLWRRTSETLSGSVSGKLRENRFDYESLTGNLTAVSRWLAGGEDPVVTFSYDYCGNQLTMTDARGAVTATGYDADTRTFPVTRTNPLGHATQYAYDERFGKITRVTDPNGNTTRCTYDAFGRLVQTDHPDGGRQAFVYDDTVMPRSRLSRTLENALGDTVEQHEFFDGLGRRVQSVGFGEDGRKIVTRYGYDEMGRNDLVEGPFFSSARGVVWPMDPPGKYPWRQVGFDYRGRPLSEETADGEHGSVVTGRQYSGFAVVTTDPDGAARTERKDCLGRIIEVIEHSDQGDFRTRYRYDAAGDLLEVIDHHGNITSIVYDTLGRKSQMDDPDMGLWRYAYDANGNLIAQTDAKQQTITFSYDALNRIAAKNYSTEDPDVIYGYDNPAVPNGIGRTYSITNSTATTVYNAYDERGRILSVSKIIAGSPQVYTTGYGFDLSGKQVSMSYPDGYQVINTFYPGCNLLQRVVGGDGTEFASLTGYEPPGKIGRIDHGNGTYTIHSYDPESYRMSAIVTGRAGPAPILQEKRYRYSAAGDIIQIVDNVEGVGFDYTYDKLHRLTGESSGGAYEPISYTYDAIGNITSKIVGAIAMAYSYEGDHPHAARRISLNGKAYDYSYDANGNMTGGPDFTDPNDVASRIFAYNADNMPLMVVHKKNGSLVTSCFQYDASNTRAAKTTGISQTVYIGDHSEVIDGVITNYVFAGNLRVAKIAAGELTYYHKDHLGSTSAVTDAYGAARAFISYTPFGGTRKLPGTSPPVYAFTDQELEPEIGLYNYNARLYDPGIGRFISADSIVPNPFDPQLINRFCYVRNNPLIYIDPSGHRLGDGYASDSQDFDDNSAISNNFEKSNENGQWDSPLTEDDYITVHPTYTDETIIPSQHHNGPSNNIDNNSNNKSSKLSYVGFQRWEDFSRALSVSGGPAPGINANPEEVNQELIKLSYVTYQFISTVVIEALNIYFRGSPVLFNIDTLPKNSEASELTQQSNK